MTKSWRCVTISSDRKMWN